jgi:hypothetical protein
LFTSLALVPIASSWKARFGSVRLRLISEATLILNVSLSISQTPPLIERFSPFRLAFRPLVLVPPFVSSSTFLHFAAKSPLAGNQGGPGLSSAFSASSCSFTKRIGQMIYKPCSLQG